MMYNSNNNYENDISNMMHKMSLDNNLDNCSINTNNYDHDINMIDNNIINNNNIIDNNIIDNNIIDNNIIDNKHECPICIESSLDYRKIMLNCEHIYHFECLTKWFSKYNNICPLCKKINCLEPNFFSNE